MAVFVEAVHRVTPFLPEVFDRWLRFYDETAVPAMRRHGYDLIGAWRHLTGAVGEDVVLIRFPSLAAFEEASAALGRDEAIAAGMAELRRDLPDFAVSEVVKLGNSVPGVSSAGIVAAREASPEGSHCYLQVTSRTRSMPALIDQLSQPDAEAPAGVARKLVTMYQTRIGRRDELTSIWVLSRGRAGENPCAVPGLFGGRLADDEQIQLMAALPYSPLQ